MALEVLGATEVAASRAWETILGLGLKKPATVLLRWSPPLVVGEAGPEVGGKAGAKDGFSGDTGRVWGILGKLLLTGEE